jgi:hypothetical protein
MKNFRTEKVLNAFGCLACTVVLWIHLDQLGASEFIGGSLTGPLYGMADLGFLFFLLALVLTFFFRRIAAAIALTAALICLPLYLYALVPGAYHWMFKGEYSVPFGRPFRWDSWAIVGIFSLVIVATLSIRSYLRIQADA